MPFKLIAGALPLLYQTEWCPSSRRVRQRLTELDVTFVAVPVPVERDERNELFVATGTRSIPTLVAEDGGLIVGEDEILDYLNSRFDEPLGATAHRLKAAKAHRKLLEEAA